MSVCIKSLIKNVNLIVGLIAMPETTAGVSI